MKLKLKMKNAMREYGRTMNVTFPMPLWFIFLVLWLVLNTQPTGNRVRANWTTGGLLALSVLLAVAEAVVRRKDAEVGLGEVAE